MDIDMEVKTKENNTSGYVSTIHQCETEDSSKLCFYNLAQKLGLPGQYNIGGTYRNGSPHLWFYFVTLECHGDNYLFSLFVTVREPGDFSIMLPKEKTLFDIFTSKVDINCHEAHTFHPTLKEENLYLKTYAFNKEQLNEIKESLVFMPIKIRVNLKFSLSDSIVTTIKNYHNATGILTRDSKTDYTIKSISGQSFGVHKIILASSSAALRNFMKTNDEYLKLDIGDEMIEILLQFMYTGTVLNIKNLDSLAVLELAEKLQFVNLSIWIQDVICKEININNAVDIAVLSKRLNMTKIRDMAFMFIKKNPDVLKTESWEKLHDGELIKSLINYLHSPS